jgi:hypothetical protein
MALVYYCILTPPPPPQPQPLLLVNLSVCGMGGEVAPPPEPKPTFPPSTDGQPASLRIEDENCGGRVLNLENDDSGLAVKVLFC